MFSSNRVGINSHNVLFHCAKLQTLTQRTDCSSKDTWLPPNLNPWRLCVLVSMMMEKTQMPIIRSFLLPILIQDLLHVRLSARHWTHFFKVNPRFISSAKIKNSFMNFMNVLGHEAWHNSITTLKKVPASKWTPNTHKTHVVSNFPKLWTITQRELLFEGLWTLIVWYYTCFKNTVLREWAQKACLKNPRKVF